jgi:hypothetical protein
MLGSAHAGERDAAARQAEALRRKLGLTWADMLAAQPEQPLPPQSAPPPPRPAPPSTDYVVVRPGASAHSPGFIAAWLSVVILGSMCIAHFALASGY